jgi:ATP-dependent DNA helicase RecQ
MSMMLPSCLVAHREIFLERKTCSLRAWRSEVARKRGVPAYVVLHDTTIDGIATTRPTTLGKLRDIPGIGDKKLEHYGEDLLALIAAARPSG